MTHFYGSILTGGFQAAYGKQFFYYFTEKASQFAYIQVL